MKVEYVGRLQIWDMLGIGQDLSEISSMYNVNIILHSCMEYSCKIR